ncbi:glycosyltransferase [Niallia sp. 03190]|uniref:glycosyltransferase n=1 Tax=Niallia sp. 03190 TaxID=3458061 RepID=UPI004043C468
MRIIVVLYNCTYNNSLTLTSLNQIDLKYKKEIDLDIYDNSLEPFDCSKVMEGFKTVSYVSNPKNPGLAVAYNYSYSRANEFNNEWLLLLDQDSKLNNEFFINLFSNIEEKNNNFDIVAIIPNIYTCSRLISPLKTSKIMGIPSCFTSNDNIIDDEIRAINSCSLIRVKFLKEIGGFNLMFPLDCLDHWLFKMIHSTDHKVLLTHQEISHNLSIIDYKSYVSEVRYKSILSSSHLFHKKYERLSRRFFYKVKLFRTFLIQLIRVPNKNISMMTLKYLLGRKI